MMQKTDFQKKGIKDLNYTGKNSKDFDYKVEVDFLAYSQASTILIS